MENAERQNKLFKNKLTGIIRQAKKDYLIKCYKKIDRTSKVLGKF